MDFLGCCSLEVSTCPLQGLQVCARQGVSGYERPPAHSYGESGVPARAEAVLSLLGGFASVETQPAAHAVVLCVSKGIGRCLGSYSRPIILK